MENDTGLESESFEKDVLYTFIEEINKLNIFSPTKETNEVDNNKIDTIDQSVDIKNNLNVNLNCDLNFTVLEAEDWNTDYGENRNDNGHKNQQLSIKSEESDVIEPEGIEKIVKLIENANKIKTEEDNDGVTNLADYEKTENNLNLSNRDSFEMGSNNSNKVTVLGAQHITDSRGGVSSTSSIQNCKENSFITVILPKISNVSAETNKETQTIFRFLRSYNQKVILPETTNSELNQQEKIASKSTGNTTAVKKVLPNSVNLPGQNPNNFKNGHQQRKTASDCVAVLFPSNKKSELPEIEKSKKKEIISDVSMTVLSSENNLLPTTVIPEEKSCNENYRTNTKTKLHSEKCDTSEKRRHSAVQKEHKKGPVNRPRNPIDGRFSKCHKSPGKSDSESFNNIMGNNFTHVFRRGNCVLKRKNPADENTTASKKQKKSTKKENNTVKIQECVVRLEKMPFLDRLLDSKKIPLNWDPSFCDLCDPKRLFTSKPGLEEHLSKEHLPNSTFNNFSKMILKSSNIWNSEEKILYNTRSRIFFDDIELFSLPEFDCELCNKSFTTHQGLTQHKRIHNLKKVENVTQFDTSRGIKLAKKHS